MRNQTSAITHGAIAATIFILLLIVLLYVPFLNLAALFFLPLPFMVQMLRYGWKSTLVVGAVAAILTLIIAPVAVMITLMAASVGGVMAYFYLQQKGTFAPIIGGTITYLANYLVGIVLSYFLFDINVVEAMQQYVQDMIKITEETADFMQIPLDEQQLALYKKYIHWISYMFPSFMILSSLTLAGLNHLISRPILRRLGHPLAALPPFREWSLPKSLLFYYLVSLIVILLGLAEEGTATFLIVINLQPILEILLFIQGLAVIAYYGHFKKMGRALPIIAVILTFFIPPVMTMIVRMIGIFELGLGIRKRIKS